MPCCWSHADPGLEKIDARADFKAHVPGHVWGIAEQEYPTQIGPPNLVEQAAGQQTGKKGCILDFWILSDLISVDYTLLTRR